MLNPLGDPLHDNYGYKLDYFEDSKYLFPPSPYTITITTLPFSNRQYCRQTILPSQKYSSYFICDSYQDDIIEPDKFCDFNFDCEDLSDEFYCSKETHFNCSSGFPPSIKRTKVNDNQIDCADRSDECTNNMISSSEEIVKNINLRKYIWF